MTDGHIEKRTLIEAASYPAHGPRESDPHYAIFHGARKHLIDVLGVGCWIGGATKAEIAAGLPADHRCAGATQLEAHHAVAEFAGLTEIDFARVAEDFPQVGLHTDEDFLRFAESEGGLQIICDIHLRQRGAARIGARRGRRVRPHELGRSGRQACARRARARCGEAARGAPPLQRAQGAALAAAGRGAGAPPASYRAISDRLGISLTTVHTHDAIGRKREAPA